MLSDSSILRHIGRQSRKMATYKQLMRELGLKGDARRELADRLRALVRRGELLEIDSGRYSLPKADTNRNTLVGRLSMHRDGFGFVIPEAVTLDPILKAKLAGDVFIPPPAIGSAMHGDRVLVEIVAFRPEGRAEGRIVRSVARAHPTVVGIFHYGRQGNFVTPLDGKVGQNILIPPGMEKPLTTEVTEVTEQRAQGKAKPARHRVVGDEAAQHSDWQDLDGVVVDVEITDWPSVTQNARGRVIEILGQENDFGVDVEIMIRKFHLPHRFSDAVIDEAQALSAIIPNSEINRRRDYRGVPIVTIDGETARDFDDAVHVRILENGNFELQVHIADVAQYVTSDSPLDQEARLRGTSVYFPDRAVPMLPLELSTDICSLRPQVDRLVLSSTMEMDHQGDILGYEINEGVIRSAERMTYTAVNAVIEGDAATRERYSSQVEHFERMRDLAIILNRKRQRRGSIDFDLPEAVIEFDEQGLMKSITRSERNIAHRLIEEFMLSANESVAHYLENKRVASLYRIHEKPDAKRVYDFEVIAATFGYSLGVGSLPIQRVQMKTDRRAAHGTGKRVREIEVPKDVHITPRMYQKLAAKIAGKPEERILSFLMLRSLKQARYSEENHGHFALAAPTYTHFTSPIRRYPDLIVHRILKEVLRESPETMDGKVPVGIGTGGHDLSRADNQAKRGGASVPDSSRAGAAAPQQPPSPWSKRRDHAAHQQALDPVSGPIALDELHSIAEESSTSERRADEAERELMEWKKVKFMEPRIGEDFDGLIISVTKFGFFVELNDLFVEGLVPLASLSDDRYLFHENTRQIIGQRSRRAFNMGDRVRVLLDRIDPVEKKLQFALLEERPLPPLGRKQKSKARR